MAMQGDDGEIARIIKTVERAFGRSSTPLLELDRSQQVKRTRRRGVAAVLGAMLAVIAVVGSLLAWHGQHRVRASSSSRVVAVQPPLRVAPVVFPAAPMPTTAPAGARVRPLQAALVQRRPHRPAYRSARSRQIAWARRPRPQPRRRDRAVSDLLAAETLRRALVQDRLRTQELNQSELRRLNQRGSRRDQPG